MIIHGTCKHPQRLRAFGADTGSNTHDELPQVALTDTIHFSDRG